MRKTGSLSQITDSDSKSTQDLIGSLSKIIFDRIAALFLLILTFPIFILAAIAVRLSSKGPILFRQKRLTKGEREFLILKFRTMYVDFDKDGRGIQIKGSSSAITSVGKILRQTKIDELPQLINIIAGDMSFVGPRPELPRRLQFYSPESRQVFSVLSGITSPASVLLANEEQLMEKVVDPEAFYINKLMPLKIDLNLCYLANWSFFHDLIIILATGLRIFKVGQPSSLLKDLRLAGFQERLAVLQGFTEGEKDNSSYRC